MKSSTLHSAYPPAGEKRSTLHTTMQVGRREGAPRAGRGRLRRQETLWFYITISPFLVGFVLFTGGPFLASFVLSFTKYDVVNPPVWLGLANYTDLFSDPLFWRSLRVTLEFTALSVPTGLVASLGLALLLNQRLPFIGFLRTAFYLPNIVSGVAVAMLWLWLLNPQFGLINFGLYRLFGITGPEWLLERYLGGARVRADEPMGSRRPDGHLPGRSAGSAD